MGKPNKSYNVDLSSAAKEAKRKYAREWRRNNPDKIKEAQRRYWEKKAAQMASEDKVCQE